MKTVRYSRKLRLQKKNSDLVTRIIVRFFIHYSQVFFNFCMRRCCGQYFILWLSFTQIFIISNKKNVIDELSVSLDHWHLQRTFSFERMLLAHSVSAHIHKREDSIRKNWRWIILKIRSWINTHFRITI